METVSLKLKDLEIGVERAQPQYQILTPSTSPANRNPSSLLSNIPPLRPTLQATTLRRARLPRYPWYLLLLHLLGLLATRTLDTPLLVLARIHEFADAVEYHHIDGSVSLPAPGGNGGCQAGLDCVLSGKSLCDFEVKDVELDVD